MVIETRVYPERENDCEQRRDSKMLSDMSFGSPITASSPLNIRRDDRDQGYNRQERDATTTSSGTGFENSTSSTLPVTGTMTRPLSLGFAPSEADAYLGIQVACEKIAKAHGFQIDAVFRVYLEVKDLRKAEEIVISMKRAAEKDAIERIMMVREKVEK